MEQPSSRVAVAAEKKRTTNGDCETELQVCGGATATWPCTDIEDVNLRRDWQTAADTLGGYVRLDSGNWIVAFLEIARRDIWCPADPGMCGTKQRVTVFDRFGNQMDELAQAAPLSTHRVASSPPRIDVARPPASWPADPPPTAP